ncbi:hypothetical protein BGZ70_002749 [Mortierella alpina]|uniref:Rad21/Rec8-like protein N-terminal domain-containing protein n=1 Tax=Mortierella alpina TaxID=64518 RepID=A0A9P6LWE9_MORAP|nr:hypothetical protein BGZ70_002749 [Mortierella alpina]
MFYSKEILTRKDSNLGLIWLAATMGARSGLSKLSKKEVNGVNIIRTCRDISQPAEPFALRFSSNLMVGVTRVYSQQYSFYFADVSSTWIRLKRDLAIVQSENLDMAHPEARLNVITCDYDLQIERDLIRPLKIFQDLELEVARGSRGTEVAVEFGWAAPSSIELGGGHSDDSSLSPDVFMLDVNDERRRKITLDEHSTITGSGSGQNYGEAFNLSDDVLMVEDNGFYIDSEGNVVDYLPEGFHVEDDALVPITNEPFEALGKRKREDVDAGALTTIAEQEKRFTPTQHDDFEGLPFDNHEQGGELEVSTAKKKARTEGWQRKPAGLVIDYNTMLSREELLDSRDNFLRNQESLHREREAKQATASAKALIDQLLAHPLSVSNVGPDLSSFWSVAGAHAWIDRGATRGTDEANPGALSALGSTFDDNTPFMLGVNEVPYTEEEPLELEIRRRQQSSDSMSTPAGMSAGDFKLGNVHDMPMNMQHEPLDLDDHRDEELGPTQARLVYEQETSNFLEYVRARLKESHAHSVSFDDLISVQRRRGVAASAFHHVLSKFCNDHNRFCY